MENLIHVSVVSEKQFRLIMKDSSTKSGQKEYNYIAENKKMAKKIVSKLSRLIQMRSK